MKSHIFFDSKAISDRLDENNSLIQNVVVSSAQHEREVEYHSNTDLCSHCKTGTVEIFQVGTTALIVGRRELVPIFNFTKW